MIKSTGIYVLVLLGLMMVPVLVQPWHVVAHHAGDDPHHTCVASHKHDDSARGEGLPGSREYYGEICYTCDFEFPANVLPEGIGEITMPHSHGELIVPDPRAGFKNVGVSVSDPRGPPLF